MVGASAIVEGFGAVGAREPWTAGLGSRPSRPTAQLALQGLQLGPQRGAALVRDVDQIVVDTRLAPLPPVGLESPADLVDAAGQVDIQAVEVVAGSVAHLDSVLGPRSIGCSPPEPACRGQTTKTHFEEDVRFACDCDIAFVMRDSGCPRAIRTSLSRTALIDGNRAVVSIIRIRSAPGQLDLSFPGSASTQAKSCAAWSRELGGATCTMGMVSQSATPAMPTEMDAITSAPFFNCSHRCGSNITATLFPICSH